MRTSRINKNRIKYRTVTSSVKVCSEHFEGEDFSWSTWEKGKMNYLKAWEKSENFTFSVREIYILKRSLDKF